MMKNERAAFEALKKRAVDTLRPWAMSPSVSSGTVAAALETAEGHVFTGVCMDVPCGIGFCAEHAAIAAMVTAGENRIVRMVAVADREEGARVVPPCGRCREFMHQICPENLDCEILLENRVATLRELLPERWDG